MGTWVLALEVAQAALLHLWPWNLGQCSFVWLAHILFSVLPSTTPPAAQLTSAGGPSSLLVTPTAKAPTAAAASALRPAPGAAASAPAAAWSAAARARASTLRRSTCTTTTTTIAPATSTGSGSSTTTTGPATPAHHTTTIPIGITITTPYTPRTVAPCARAPA